MTWSAPSFLSFSAFWGDDVVAITVAPAALANWRKKEISRGDHEKVESFTHLKTKHANTASSLHQNNLTRLQRLQAIERIPAGESSACEGTVLEGREVLRCLHEALLVPHTIFPQSSVNYSSKTGSRGGDVDVAILVALVEKRRNLVTFLELGHLRSDLDDLASTVGRGNNGEIAREWIFALENAKFNIRHVHPGRALNKLISTRHTFGIIKSR